MSAGAWLQTALLAAACASALVAAVGTARGGDALAKLIYASIPSSTSLVFLAAALVMREATPVTVAQALMLVVLSVVSGGVTGNRIAGVIRRRAEARGEAGAAEGA